MITVLCLVWAVGSLLLGGAVLRDEEPSPGALAVALMWPVALPACLVAARVLR